MDIKKLLTGMLLLTPLTGSAFDCVKELGGQGICRQTICAGVQEPMFNLLEIVPVGRSAAFSKNQRMVKCMQKKDILFTINYIKMPEDEVHLCQIIVGEKPYGDIAFVAQFGSEMSLDVNFRNAGADGTVFQSGTVFELTARTGLTPCDADFYALSPELLQLIHYILPTDSDTSFYTGVLSEDSKHHGDALAISIKLNALNRLIEKIKAGKCNKNGVISKMVARINPIELGTFGALCNQLKWVLADILKDKKAEIESLFDGTMEQIWDTFVDEEFKKLNFKNSGLSIDSAVFFERKDPKKKLEFGGVAGVEKPEIEVGAPVWY